MQIRTECPDDVPAIAALTTRAFAGAPHSGGNEARIIAALRAAGALALSLVAQDEAGTVIGHVAFSPVAIGGHAGAWLALGPVSVESERQSCGIGSALIREGLARIAAKGAQGCVLLGDPAYYTRFGFESDPALTYLDYQTPHLQRLVIAGEPPRGAVTFHPAFDVP